MTHTKEYVFFGTTRCFGTQILSIYYYKIDTNIRKHLLQCNTSVPSYVYSYSPFILSISRVCRSCLPDGTIISG
jgi:hypothetical protein